MKKQRVLRLKAWLLTLCMVISLVPVSAFAATGKTYVSLGDSMSNGYGLADYGENTSGYQDYGVGAYPEEFYQNYLMSAGYTTHEQMAMSAMRAEDLHFLLEFPVNSANALAVANAAAFNEASWKATFGAGDKYTWETFTKNGGRIERNGLDTKTVAKAYQDAVKGADLISLGIGNANFGVFLMENITKSFGLFGEKSSTDWMDTALNGCDDAVAAKLNELIAQIKPTLKGSLSALGEAADPMVDAILYTVISYLVNYQGVLDAIVKLNGNAEVIIVGIMDTTSGMSVSFEVNGKEQTLPLSTVLGLLVEPINTYMTALPALLQAKGDYPNATFYYAEAPSVQCLVETFGSAILKDDNVIRNRFFETIVGTESDPGFIWGLADEMLGEMALVDGVTVKLTYDFDLEDVKGYKAALDAATGDQSDYTALQKYIDPILNGETEKAKNDAINKLLSLALYLSLEATVLEASEPAYGKLNTAALAALANDDFAAAFDPVMGAIEDPIDEVLGESAAKKISDAVKGMIASLASKLATTEMGYDVSLDAKDVEALLSGAEEQVNEVFFKLADQMVQNMKEEELPGVGTVDLSTLGLDAVAIGEIYEAAKKDETHAKLYEMAAKIVSDMESLAVEGYEINPSELGITATEIEAIYKVANGNTSEKIDGKTVEEIANNFYYRTVKLLAPQLGYIGLEVDDVKSIIDPDDDGLTPNVFAVAQTKYAEEPFTFNDIIVDDKPFTIKLGELGLDAEGTDLKKIYEYALDPSNLEKEAAADKVFYKIATVVANKTVFADVDPAKQPGEGIIEELITVEDGNYSEDVFKLAMDLAGDQVVYTIKDAAGNDKNIKLSDLGLDAEGKELKALYDYARNPVDTNPNKDDAYDVYYKLIEKVAPEMGLGDLKDADIKSVIDESMMPTDAVFSFALTEAGNDPVYEGLTLNQLGVNANDLKALYYFAKGEETVTINGVPVASETAADAALYKIAAAVANNDPEYADLGLLDAHIKSIVEDTVPSAAVFEVALKIAKDKEVYNKDDVVVKVSDLGLTGSELRAVYIDAKDGTTTSALAAKTYNKIAAIVANKTTFAGVTDSNGKSLNADDIAKILSGIYETKVFELALKISGHKEVYRDGDTVVTLGELNLSGDELKALYEYAKTKEETDAANAVLYKIAAAVANKTTFKDVTGEKLEAGDIVKIINKQYDEKLFNLALQVADKNKVVYTEGTGENAVNITLGELDLDGAELEELYDYASTKPTPAEMPAVVENILYDVAAKVANKTTFKDAENKLKAADIADIIAENYTEGVFNLAIQVVDPGTVVYSEGAAKIKLSDLELTGADLLALYNYAKAGNPDATTDKVNTILYNIAAKVAKQTVFAGKNVALDGDLVAKIVAGNASGTYDPAVFALAVDVADGNTVVYSDGGKNITLSELDLTGSELQALYNYDKNASDENASAANDVFNKIAAAVANKTVFENATGEKLVADDIAKILNKQYDEKLFNLAIQVVDPTTVVYSEGTGADAVSITLGELNLDGTKLKTLYAYASAKPTPEVMPEAVADILYYIAAKVANKTVFNGKGDPVTKEIVGKIDAGTYDESVFGLAFKVVPADTEVYSGVTLGELNLDGAKLKALYEYAKAGNANATTDEVEAILYDIAAKVANETTFAGKGNPVTKDIVEKIADNNYDASVFGLALKVADGDTVVYSNSSVAVTLNELGLTAGDLQALYSYDKTPSDEAADDADAALCKVAAKVLSNMYGAEITSAQVAALLTEDPSDDAGAYNALYGIAAAQLNEQTNSNYYTAEYVKGRYEAQDATVVAAVGLAKTTVGTEFTNAKNSIAGAENNTIANTVDTQLGKVNTELNKAKSEITGPNSVIVTTVNTELGKVKTKLDAAKTEITGDNSAIVTTVDGEFGDVKTKLDNAKTSIGSADNNPVMNAVNTELQSVETKLTTAKGEIAGPNSVIVSTVDNELGEVKTKFNAAKDAITGDNSAIVTTVDTEFGKVETELNKARNSIIGEDSLVLSAVDEQLGNVTTELDNAKKKFKETIVPDIDIELGNVSEKFTNAKNDVSDPNGDFMSKVEEKFASVRADFNKAVYGDANEEGANGKILAAVDENVTEVKNQFNKAKNMISGENSEIVSKVETNLNDVKEKFASAQTKVSDLVKKGVDGARDKITSGIDEAKSLIEDVGNLNTYFDLLCKFIALDDVMPAAAAKSPELMSLLHLFSRMLIGNGLGAHPSAAGHGTLAEAVEKAFVEKHTVQKELAKDSVLVLGGMAALLTKFGADILGIAFDTETIKNYLNNPQEAVRDLAETMDQRFKDYESSKATLEGAIASLEIKLDALVGRMEMLSELLADKQQELSDALYQVADKTDMAADTAVKNLKAIVDDLAAAIDMTRKTIETVQDALDEAKAQLNALETSMKELKDAVETLKKGADDMNDLFTKFNGAVDALVVAYQTATDTMLKGISAVKTAYQKTEAASQQAKAYATKATTAASKAYDDAYKALSDLYDAMPADMALVLFGAAGGGAFVALTLTKDHLVPYAEARIAEKQAELDAEVLKLETEIAEKTEYMNSLVDNAAEKGKVKAEIDSMKAQILKLKNETAAEIAELRRGIDEAHAGNLTMLKADYQKLVESVTSGVRPAIKQAMDDLVASAVKTVCQRITTTITAISTTIGIIDEKIDLVVNDSKNSYTVATHDDYLITDDSYYVALGDSVAAAEQSYVDLLSVAKTTTKKHDIPFNNLAVANQSVTEAVSYVKSNAAEIANADLITVGYGNTTFAKLALDRAKTAMKGESTADLNWSKYIGDAGAAYVASNLAEIEASLVAAGVNEKAQNSNAAKAAVMAVEAYAYAAVEYLCTLPSVIAAIREINPSAVLVIVGMHNPMGDLELTHESADGAKTTIQLGAYVGKLVDGVDVYGTLYAMLVSRTAKAIFVDTPVVDVDPVNDEDNEISADAFLLKVKSDGINPYPTADGQADIKDYILNALTITDSANTPIDGDVTIVGEAIYGQTIEALYEGNAEGFVTYQWYRDGVAIANATSSEYKLAAADVGHNITVTVTGTGDYKNSLTSVAVTAEKAPYPDAEHPVVTAYYGDILAEVLLNNNWKWKNNGDLIKEVGAAGSETEWEAVYTPTVDEATVEGCVVYKEAVVMVTVKVEKATISTKDIVAPKAVADLTYTGQTQTLIEAGSVKGSASTEVVMQYALGNAEGPTEEWSVTLPAATEAGTYYVWYRVEGGNNYVSTTPQCITATINALPTYTVTYYANGGTGTMTAGTATKGVPFALPACGFTAPAGKMFKGWSYEANGAVITDSKISVTSGITLYAIWEDIFEEAPEAEDLTYDGTEKPLITPEQPKDGTTIEYTIGTKDAPTGEWSDNIPTGKDAGTYYVWYRVLDGEGNVIHIVWIEVIIYEATPEYTAPEAVNGMIWNGEARPLVTPVGTVTGGTMQYALGTKDGHTGEWSDNIPTGVWDAGTYYVWYQIIGDENYKDILVIDHIVVEIGKAPATVNAPKANTNLQYNGSVQDLIANVGGVDGGKLQYAFGTDDTTQPGDSAWQDNLDSAKMNAGTYYIWYRIVCDNNHEYAGDTIVCVTVTVVKAPLTVTTADQFIYYGDEIEYRIPKIDGFVNDVDKENLEKLLFSALNDYTYAPSESGGGYDDSIPEVAPTHYRLRNAARTAFVPKDVGIYDISLSGDLTAYPELGNYEVTVNSGKLTIMPKPIVVEWDELSFTYDGTAKVPAPTATGVVNGDVVELTVSGAQTDAGTYTATAAIVASEKSGNYVLTNATQQFTINKADSVFTVPEAVKDLVYTGEAQQLVTAGTATGGTMMYSTDGKTFSEEIPTATEAGTYTVWYKVAGDANHNDTTVYGPIKVTIAEKPVGTLLGDVDLDGDVDAADMTALVRHVAGIEELTDPRAILNGDVDQDDDIDAADITKLTRYVAGIITEW